MGKTVMYIVCVLLTEMLGFTVGMMTGKGTRLYAESTIKPPLSPPSILFHVAWTVLYALMGIGVVMAVNSGALFSLPLRIIRQLLFG